ncbi:MAG: helix-turn-helix domain-containing protein [Spirochaetales bacterium]|nr:helix-turn-helix domain-containing protein [Spirochaetales bacterium]
MYSVFLVEDEIVTREGIRNSICWEETPFTFAGEAPDGEMALHALRDIKPDILITDIRMPFLDGLVLSRMIKKDQPWIKIIILSGHDEFRYAKEAISIGVEEYMLKPVSSADMLETLNRVASRIEKEKKSLKNLEKLKRRVQSTEEIIRDKWLSEIVTGQIESVNAIERAESMGIDLLPGGYGVMILEVHTKGEQYEQFAIAKEIIGDFVENREDILFFSLSMEKHVLLVKSMHHDYSSDTLYSVAQGIKFEIGRHTDCSLSVGIGSVADYIGDIVHSYSDADRALRYMQMTGQHIIIGAADLDGGSSLTSRGSDSISGRLRSVQYGNTGDLIDQYLSVAESGSDRSYLPLLLKKVTESLNDLINSLHGSSMELIPRLFDSEKVSSALKDSDSFRAFLEPVLESWIRFRDENVQNSSRIEKARTYINENFMSQDISLNSLASHVSVSPNHFSTIFSQEMGVTFIEYLTSVRLEHAKELLRNSRMKCADISYEVGYSDPHYFSFIFKKNFGISPREYRAEAVDPAVHRQSVTES